MNVIDTALEFPCPVCDAKPREECHRIDGHTLPQLHSKRKALALGVKFPPRREDMNRAPARIISEATRD